MQPGTKSAEASCAICLTAPPLLTACGHPFCESCMRSYVLSKLEKENRIENFELPCPMCKQALLPQEIEVVLSDGTASPGERSFTDFLSEEARKLPRRTLVPRELRTRRCRQHTAMLLLVVAAYLWGLCTANYWATLAAALASPMLYMSRVTTLELVTATFPCICITYHTPATSPVAFRPTPMCSPIA